MDFKTKIIQLMEQAIEKEQHPEHREKPLTLGLQKAIEIARKETDLSYRLDDGVYEYQVDGQVWHRVNNNSNIYILMKCGFNIRRK